MPGEWTQQLADDLKSNETFTQYDTLSDFAKAHLDVAGKVSELEGKTTEYEGKVTDLNTRLENAIIKPGENATEDEVKAFHKSLGVPEKPDDYEFVAAEGVEHDENMINWARNTFHAANLTKDQAGIIQTAWDGFIKGMVEAEEQANTEAVNKANEVLKKEWGPDFDKNIEFVRRGFQKFTDTEFDKFCDDSGIGNNPVLIKFLYNVGKAMGDDFSPQGAQQRGRGEKEGILYDKSPAPPTA